MADLYPRVQTHLQTVDFQLETLREEMRSLSARLFELESAGPTPSSKLSASGPPGSLQRILNPPKSPTYVGPTSAEFGLNRQSRPSSHAQSHDSPVGDEEGDDLDLSTTAQSPTPLDRDKALDGGDPLSGLGLQETLRLVQVYEDTVGIMYPCVDLASLRAYVVEFYHSQDPAFVITSDLSRPDSDQDWFHARDIQVLKILLATALLVDSHGRSERAAQLADSVEDRFASRLKIAEVDMKEILILTLLVCKPRTISGHYWLTQRLGI